MLDNTIGKEAKATFVGHSFGSLILSWMVQSRSHRVANCVFLDPVCFQLHQKDILFNFHLKRVDHYQKGVSWESPLSPSGIIGLAGTEMHTNYAMLRHFWRATNAIWLSDLQKHSIPTTVLLSENDEFVPSADIERFFLDYKHARLQWKAISIPNEYLPLDSKNSVLLRTDMLPGASHG